MKKIIVRELKEILIKLQAYAGAEQWEVYFGEWRIATVQVDPDNKRIILKPLE